MKQKLLKLSILGSVVFFAMGCSSSNNAISSIDDGSSNQGSASSSSSSAPANASKVEISFWHTFGQTIVDNLKPQVKKFQDLVLANDNVDLTVNLVPESNYDTIKDDISKGIDAGQGNIPTLAVAYPDHVADYIEAEGDQPGKFVVNLNIYMI